MKVRVRDTTLFFDVEGAKLVPDGDTMREQPTLLLLHGGPGFDHSSLKPAFSALAPDAQLVYLDHRGNGRSDRGGRERWTLADWGDDVRAFCEVLGIEHPIVLGQSFGGFVAQSYATRHPDHVGGLILSSTTARMRLDRVVATFERLGGPEAGKVARAFWEDPRKETLAPYAQTCFPLYNTRPGDPDGNGRVQWNLDVLFHFSTDESRRFDFHPALCDVRCPTLILAGEQDPITPAEDAQDMADALPESLARLHRFEDCGHGVFRDAPDRAFELIRAFLAECSAEAGP